jgi:hypothetical protein
MAPELRPRRPESDSEEDGHMATKDFSGPAAPPGTPDRREVNKVVVASLIGTTIEWCYRTAFTALEDRVERGATPPASATLPRRDGGDMVNACSIG